MTYSTGLRNAVCGAALIAGGAAHADVTAAEVWENWKSQIDVYGEGAVTIGSEEVSGDTVAVRDLTINVEDPDIDMVIEFGDLDFTEQGDGSVSVAMAESYPVTITGADGVVVTVMVSQSGLEMIVSGDPDAMNYAITADKYTIALQDIVDGDVTFTGDVQFVASDLSSTYDVETGDLRTVAYDASVAALDLLVDIEVPGAAGEYVTGAAKMEDISMQGEVEVPLDVNFEDPDALFTSGFAAKGGYVIDSGSYIFDINADGDQASGSASIGETTLDVAFDSNAVSYTTKANDIAMNLSASELPFPVEIGLSEYGVGFEMPLSKSDEPGDFGLSFDLVDLTVNDMIWNLFDPGSVLPRDPATAQFAISGLAKPLIDLMDPEQQASVGPSDMPFELNSVALDRLRIAAAGALVTGVGEFTFDNNDLTSFAAPLPRPEGDVIVEISGLNGLLDNLVAMGLVADEDIMAPRMMMGMFARSTGDDQMETKIEVTPAGEVLANGQRIR